MQVIEKTCRKQIASVKRKNGDTAFCTFCNHYSLVNEEKMCMCCGTLTKKLPTNNSIMERFEETIEANEKLIELYRKNPVAKELMFEKRIKIGMWWYFVSIQWFVDYIDLSKDHSLNKYDMFFHRLKETCPRIG